MKRFWDKVDIKSSLECWDWQASKNHKGYGKFTFQYQYWRSHRFAWYITNGDIPEGMHVLHNCDNVKCCNPNHLRLGTNSENAKDRKDRNRYMSGDRNYFYGKHFSGELAASSKLKSTEVSQIKDLYKNGVYNMTQLGQLYNVSKTTTRMAIRGFTWGPV